MEHTRLGYWITEAGDVTPRPPLDEDRDADLLIVGGGYTGMWTAWHARRLAPEARIVLLESEPVCGRGPSGRNGGFCEGMWTSLASMRARWGDAPALAVGHAAEAAVERIASFCTEDGVDAWWRPGGYLEVSTTPAHDGTGNAALEACRELGVPDKLRAVSAAEVQERCASPEFRAGVIEPAAATVQPARLALALRHRLLEWGVEIYESSPVRRFREGDDGVEATTATGARVRGRRGVLAIGAAAKAHGAPLHGRLTVASSHIVITEPVPDVIEKLGWTGGESITDGRALVHYFRTTPDGRIAFGWGGGRIAMGARLHGRTEVDPDAVEADRRHLLEYFPDLQGRRVTHAWGGPIDASPTHLPAVTSLPRSRAWVAAGYTGNGVGPTNMVGLTLASLALDRTDDPTRLAFVDPEMPRVPPEPFHWVGGEAIRAGIASKEYAEMAGRRPGPISSTLARVPELIGFHIGR
ncbi:MAG TPA: FAD-dependent oxidoreductase [Solirubrobacterales bacterium]|jgi:glycine/D-amino acid oxidase-like deaminating enzyme|nr:FAD-dependent oxidoreductase [Solirubrobacterales bacterium]